MATDMIMYLGEASMDMRSASTMGLFFATTFIMSLTLIFSVEVANLSLLWK